MPRAGRPGAARRPSQPSLRRPTTPIAHITRHTSAQGPCRLRHPAELAVDPLIGRPADHLGHESALRPVKTWLLGVRLRSATPDPSSAMTAAKHACESSQGAMSRSQPVQHSIEPRGSQWATYRAKIGPENARFPDEIGAVVGPNTCVASTQAAVSETQRDRASLWGPAGPGAAAVWLWVAVSGSSAGLPAWRRNRVFEASKIALWKKAPHGPKGQDGASVAGSAYIPAHPHRVSFL